MVHTLVKKTIKTRRKKKREEPKQQTPEVIDLVSPDPSASAPPAKKSTPPGFYDKFVPLDKVPDSADCAEDECYGHTKEVIQRRIAKRTIDRVEKLLQPPVSASAPTSPPRATPVPPLSGSDSDGSRDAPAYTYQFHSLAQLTKAPEQILEVQKLATYIHNIRNRTFSPHPTATQIVRSHVMTTAMVALRNLKYVLDILIEDK